MYRSCYRVVFDSFFLFLSSPCRAVLSFHAPLLQQHPHPHPSTHLSVVEMTWKKRKWKKQKSKSPCAPSFTARQQPTSSTRQMKNTHTHNDKILRLLARSLADTNSCLSVYMITDIPLTHLHSSFPKIQQMSLSSSQDFSKEVIIIII
ncbi:hypothetical protein B0T21DRAFT_354462 [Apiosordaria backusii]|uniref:Secreted protein n=1 Tax=Apiosordaria backusii TaxID=314023 RepID=A0AA40EXR6_9PEZI|nr:hypothetical protein B0T21DRAFT_354462 [Apiosordaria backusii]